MELEETKGLEPVGKIFESTCKTCGRKIVDVRPRKVCSKECLGKHMRKKEPTKNVEYICQQCGKKFTAPQSQKRKYCNADCFQNASRGKPKPRRFNSSMERKLDIIMSGMTELLKRSNGNNGRYDL